jgi:tetratricopeptide (TPR) repeat protein
MINKSIAIYLVLLFVGCTCHSQKIDSLRGLLTGKSGVERVDILYELSNDNLDLDPNAALAFGVEGYALSVTNKDSLRMVRIGRLVARAARQAGLLDSAVRVYERILSICRIRQYTVEYPITLNSYALTLTFKAEYDKALSYYFELLNDRSPANDSLAVSITLNNIGLVYYKLKQYEKALQYFNRCYEVKQRVASNFDLDLLMINTGLCYAYLGNFVDSNKCIDKATRACGEDCPPQRLTEINFAEGVLNFGLGDLPKAEKFFLNSYALAKSINDIRFQLDNIDYLANIYLAQKRFYEAASYLHAGEELIINHASFNLEKMKLYARLSALYREANDLRNALDYHVKYSQVKDSVYSTELTEKLMRVEAQYLERANLTKISSQEEVIKLNQAMISRQAVINRLIIVLALISVGFVILVFRNFQHKKRLNELLDKKIEERTRELKMSNEKVLNAFKEQALLNSRAAAVFNEAANRIKGVCSVGLKEVCDPVGRSCFERIDHMSQHMVEFLDLHFRNKETVTLG